MDLEHENLFLCAVDKNNSMLNSAITPISVPFKNKKNIEEKNIYLCVVAKVSNNNLSVDLKEIFVYKMMSIASICLSIMDHENVTPDSTRIFNMDVNVKDPEKVVNAHR